MGFPSLLEDLEKRIEEFDSINEYVPLFHNETIINFYNSAKTQRQEALSYLSTLKKVIEVSEVKGYDILAELIHENKNLRTDLKLMKETYEKQDLYKLYQKTLVENQKLKNSLGYYISNKQKRIIPSATISEIEQIVIIKEVIKTQIFEIHVDQKKKMERSESKLFEVEIKLENIKEILYQLIRRQTSNRNIKPLELLMRHLYEAIHIAKSV